jgi:hypothetical protein
MTAESLKDCNKRDLARLAKDHKVVGWHAMRKDQLIRALSPKLGSNGRKNASKIVQKSSDRTKPSKTAHKRNKNGQVRLKSKSALKKNPEPAVTPQSRPSVSVGSKPLEHACCKDRIITMVRDPYWLHVYWELSRSTLTRAQAALGQEWHGAHPILRLMDVSSEETTSSSERHVRDIEIHGGVNNWYIDVLAPPRSFRVDIGYLSRRNKFYVLARSNVVTTPKAGSSDTLDQNWASVQDQYEKIFHQSGGAAPAGPSSDLKEIFETVLRRPMNSLSLGSLGTGALPYNCRKFHFELEAELIVYGTTEPNARVTLQGQPVRVRPDGTFTVRFSLPDSRQIIPAVASSGDGVEERTIVLAVERNTKELEPMIHDGNEL